MPDATPERLAIGARLRAAREAAGVTQGQVAAHVGLHRPAIAEVEAGRRRISAEELRELCELYEVSPSWILNGATEARDPAIELAARKLARLKPEALDSVLELLRTLRVESSDNDR